MTTYTLSTPTTVGGIGSQITVSSFQLTSISYSSTPELAPISTGTLTITLTDPSSGYQETINYQDASVLVLWSQALSPAANTQLGDIIAGAVFAKLVADGKLPPGSLNVTA